MKKSKYFVLIILVLFLFSGCLTTFILEHNKESLIKKASKNIKISVKKISILRSENKGGKVTGYIRNLFGAPIIPIKMENSIDDALKILLIDALDAAGYSIGDSNLNLQVEVLKFWCDGYMVYELVSEIKIYLFKNDQLVFTTTINEKETFSVIWGYKELYNAYNDIMITISLKTLEAFMSDEFTRAVSN